MSIFNFMENVRKSQCNRSFLPLKGFLLLELLIALLLVAVFMAIISCYQVLNVRWQYETTKQAQALHAVTSFLEEALHNPELFDQMEYRNEQITITWEQSKKQFHATTDFFIKRFPAYEMIQLTIRWPGYNEKERKCTLFTGRVVHET